MPGPLKWLFEIVDHMSGPAQKMSKEIDRVSKSTEEASKHLGGIGEHAGKFALVTEAVHLASEGIERMADSVKELGLELLRTADAERTNKLIFESLAGSTEGGAALFEKAEDYASKAGIKIQDAVGIFRTLAKGGVKDVGENFFILAQAAGDIGSRTGQSATAVSDAFARIITKNQLASHELRGLAKFGIPFQVLAKHLGVSANNAEELQKALQGKSISGTAGVQAVVASLQELEGGRIGKLTKDIGEGFEGASNRVSNAWDKLLGKFGETQGFKDIIRLMDDIAKKLEDPSFQKAVSDFASSMASVARSLAEMLPSIATIHDVFGKDSEKLGDSASKIRQRNEEYYSGKGFFERTFGAGPNSEASPADGLDLDLLPGFQGIGTNTIKNVREETGTHSPSTEFMKIGEGWSQGLEIGFGRGGNLDAGGDGLQSPLSRSSGSHPAQVHVHQEFHVHGGGDTEEIARRILELSASGLQSPLENLAISIGGM